MLFFGIELGVGVVGSITRGLTSLAFAGRGQGRPRVYPYQWTPLEVSGSAGRTHARKEDEVPTDRLGRAG